MAKVAKKDEYGCFSIHFFFFLQFFPTRLRLHFPKVGVQ